MPSAIHPRERTPARGHLNPRSSAHFHPGGESTPMHPSSPPQGRTWVMFLGNRGFPRGLIWRQSRIRWILVSSRKHERLGHLPVKIQLVITHRRSVRKVLLLRFAANTESRHLAGLGLELQGRARLIDIRKCGGAPPTGIAFLARSLIATTRFPHLDIHAIKGFAVSQQSS